MAKKRIRFICPCGLENQNLKDWTCHWTHGIPRPHKRFGKWPKIRAIWMFLTTEISWS